MANIIPSGSWIHTMSPGFAPKERRSTSLNNQAEYYTIDDFIYTTGGGGGGGSAGSLAELINVTNNDGAFTHLPAQISAGTNIEALLRDILNPYVATTCSLTGLSVRYYNNATWGGFVSESSSVVTLEVGQRFEIQAISYTVANSDVTVDNSGSFLSNGSAVGSNTAISDVSGNYILPSVLAVNSATSVIPDAGLSYSFKMSFIDNGGNNDITINSTTKTIRFLYNIAVGANETSIVTPTLMSSLSLINTGSPKGDIAFEGNANTTDNSKYTWICYPASWGLADDIVLAATSVIGDFQSPTIVAITDHSNQTSLSLSYMFYRSTSKGAFGNGQNVTLKF